MSRIDELIESLCPEGVIFRELGDICETVAGLSGKTKADFSDGNARYVSYKNAFNHLAVDQSAPDFVKMGVHERQNHLRLGDVVLTGSSESVEEVGMSSVVTVEPADPLYLNSFCFALRFLDRTLFDPEFSKYLFRSELVRAQIKRTASGVTRINISKARLLKVRVPVPPLEVQQEIVRILDQFTQLEAELEAELEARRAQYQFIRSNLLDMSANRNVLRTTISDVCVRVSSGGTPSSGRTDYYGGDIPWLRTQDVDFNEIYKTSATITNLGLNNSTANFIPKNCVIVAMYGATAAKAAINKIPLTTNQACCNLQINPEVANFEYVFFWLSNNYEQLKSLGEGSQANLNASKVKNFPIELPPLSEQEQIVRSLKHIDLLVNGLGSGLPAELKARRKQYEYYRDKLLTFKELAA